MNIHEAALAGLLHDIGKLWQRAASSAKQRVPDGFESYTKEHVGQNGTHAIWSVAFVRQYVPQPFQDAIHDAVLMHHNPQDEMARLVALADRLSAGERERSDDAVPKQLQSVFCNLMGEGLPAHYYALRPLDLNKSTIFPSQAAQTEKDAKRAYADLWTGFTTEVKQLQGITDLSTYLEGIQAAMMRYCWCVPSAFFRSVPDISLYDHSRTTAALAASLAATFDDAEISRLLNSKDKTPVVSMIEGDVSGVQSFIYTITAKGAAKGLRARSFYLQVLSEAAARMILRELEMPTTNLLYVGGGHFYLLVPPGREAELERLRLQMARFMLKHHDGELYLAIGERPITAAELNNAKDFSEVWGEVGKVTKADKLRRYAGLSAVEQMTHLFDPRPYDETSELGLRRLEREEGGDEEKSAFSQSLYEMGTHIRRAVAIALVECEPEQLEPGSVNAALTELGYQIALVDARGRRIVGDLQGDLRRAVLLGMRETPSDDARSAFERQLGCPVASGLRYTVNVIPEKSNGDVASFSDLQAAANGLQRFGVLRMDVDNLGQLFARGFKDDDLDKSNATLSRVASLSFALSLYFEGWVGELCRQINERTWKPVRDGDRTYDVQPIYTVYSGGDDLFIVGAWDELTGLADSIRHDLTRFACENEHVHVSAGITLHGGKYPLYQAATMAEKALDSAKDISGKNAITFLGQSVKWEQWQLVTEIQGTLLKLHAANVPRSLFQTLMELYAEYEVSREAINQRRTRNDRVQKVWGPWLWHSAYRLKRMADRHKDQGDMIMALQQDMQRDEFDGIRYVGIAARWADALTRTERDKE